MASFRLSRPVEVSRCAAWSVKSQSGVWLIS